MRTIPDNLQDPGEDLRKCTVIFGFFLALYQAQVSLILAMAPRNTGQAYSVQYFLFVSQHQEGKGQLDQSLISTPSLFFLISVDCGGRSVSASRRRGTFSKRGVGR